MWNKNVETFIGCDREYKDADIVLFGAPFDGTTSYRPGARFGSRAVRGESWGMETYSPYQDRDLGDIRVFDGGDLDLPFGNALRALAMIEERVDGVMADSKVPLMVGGEHLVTLGAVRAAVRQYPGLHILHLDAHADLRDDYQGEALSHAAVMRRVWDIVGDGRVHQFGIRSGDRSEFSFAAAHTRMHRYDLGGLAQTAAGLAGQPVYLSLDLDVLDPSVLPGTGTPEAGGIRFTELLEGLLALRGQRIIGADVVELSPVYDPSGASTAAACKILREILLILGGNENG